LLPSIIRYRVRTLSVALPNGTALAGWNPRRRDAITEIQARSSRPPRQPAKLPISGAEVRQVRLGLGLSLAQWAGMLGIHERAAQRWERLKHAGPRVSSLVRLLSESQQLMPQQPLVLAPTAPAAQRGSTAVRLQFICCHLVVEYRGRAKSMGSVKVALALSGEVHMKLQARAAVRLESISHIAEVLIKEAYARAAVSSPSDA